MTKKQTPTQILAHKRALKVAQQQRYQAKLTARARAASELLTALQSITAAYEKLLVESRITKRDADAMRAMLPEYTSEARAAMQAAMEAGVA